MEKIMKNNVLNDNSKIHFRTGCSMCAVSCPHKAITIEMTKDGFYEPLIDEDLCTDCGICRKICYKFDDKVLHGNEEECLVYGAMNKDRDELKTASSGAVSAELMKQCIIDGYKVLGVAYDYDKNIAVTKIVSSHEKIEEFKGAKYFQSYTLDAFYQAIRDKSDQKYAVFGTPCQIYAISKYINLNKMRNRFLLVDIFCYGCPSINLWTKYLEYNKRKLGVAKFDKIEFRSKAYGWHEFCSAFYSKKGKYVSPRSNDMFYSLFFNMKPLCRACYDCEMRSSLSYTDIRLGDFWGYHYDRNTSGVSAVVLCGDSGKNLFEKTSEHFILKKHSFEEVKRAQSYGRSHFYNDKARKEHLALLSSDLSIEEIMKAY
jgi:coenzyme F420-reducing hydrogenase beta subunit